MEINYEKRYEIFKFKCEYVFWSNMMKSVDPDNRHHIMEQKFSFLLLYIFYNTEIINKNEWYKNELYVDKNKKLCLGKIGL